MPSWCNRQLAREQDRRRIRDLWRASCWLLLAVAPFAYWLHQQNECLQLDYALGDLRAERERWIEEERRLRIERAALERLDDIERWAKEERGLVRPAAEQVVVVAETPRPGPDWLARTPLSGARDPAR